MLLFECTFGAGLCAIADVISCIHLGMFDVSSSKPAEIMIGIMLFCSSQSKRFTGAREVMSLITLEKEQWNCGLQSTTGFYALIPGPAALGSPVTYPFSVATRAWLSMYSVFPLKFCEISLGHCKLAVNSCHKPEKDILVCRRFQLSTTLWSNHL